MALADELVDYKVEPSGSETVKGGGPPQTGPDEKGHLPSFSRHLIVDYETSLLLSLLIGR